MLEIRELTKSYHQDVIIFTNLNLRFPDRGLFFIVGRSGSGKTTLFNLIGKIDSDYQGRICFNGTEIQKIKNYQGGYVSYLFQSFHLINRLNCRRNYLLPGLFNRIAGRIEREKMLLELGIKQLGNSNILQISGGQKSRVALMRMLVSGPQIVLCDEPTGSLDAANARVVIDYLKDLARDRLVLVVSHDLGLIDDEVAGVIDFDHLEKYQEPLANQEGNSLMAVRSSKTNWLGLIRTQLVLDLRANLKMMVGLVLAFVTILTTLFVATGFQAEIDLELTNIFGTNTYTLKRKDGESFELSQLRNLQQDELVSHLYLLLDEYQFVGVGLKPDLEQEQLIYVEDPTRAKPASITQPGVVVSAKLARRLGGEDNLVGTSINIYYQYHEEVKSYPVAVAGIDPSPGVFDAICFDELDYLDQVARLFYQDPATLRGEFVTLSGSRLSDEYLEQKYGELSVRQLGASLREDVGEVLDRINLGLGYFSGLSLLASVFLVGEVMYLGVLKNRKNIGIYRILGAKSRDVMAMVLGEVFILVSGGFVIAVLETVMLSRLINTLLGSFFEGELLSDSFVMVAPFQAGAVYLAILVLTLSVSLIPAIIAARQEPLNVLKLR